MNKQKITNKDIWGCLYKRELAYIQLVCRMLSFKEIKKAIPHIISCLKDMDTNILSNCTFIKSKEIKKRELFLKHPIWGILINKNKIQFKKIRRFLFSIHGDSSGWLIQLFGIQISKGINMYRPSLVKFKIGGSK